MFVITQFIGLYVLNANPFEIKTIVNGTTQIAENPSLSWIQPPQITQESDFSMYFGSLLISFIIAIVILFLLTKFKINVVLRIWFFSVVSIALFITINAILLKSPLAIFANSLFFIIPAVIVALVLGFIKIFRQNFLVHNLTELLIYPGIATVFVPILNLWFIIVLLILISIYDMWAVWHSGIMQKMAKYQINKLKVFSGFFVPYISKEMRMNLKKLKKSKIKKKIKVNMAILGGGDIVFPIISSGVVLKTGSISLPFHLLPNFAFHGGFLPAVFVIAGATLGLTLLFVFSEKKKFYPAMPFISAGIFLGLILSQILL
ncbi:Signal-peptide peptidase, presenilin aspartyl protease [uncultured archaeon]|nr:Signal-peptide peptidase, presenilin aspartyl protease [uncultured archaeon]